MENPVSAEPGRKTRRACEPCRAKKIRCTGERPACALCQRVGDPCVYEPRRSLAKASGRIRASKPSSAQGRVGALESQVSQLYEIIDSLQSSRDAETTRLSSAQRTPTTRRHSQARTSIPDNREQPEETLPTWSVYNPEPSPEAFQHCLRTVRASPPLVLPLLNSPEIETEIKTGPSHLRWSFMAFALRISSHAFYLGIEADAIEFYRSAAQNSVDAYGADDTPPVTNIQTLIFLSLIDIFDGSPKAWIRISSAASLEALRRTYLQCPEGDSERGLRCYWSVYLLEKIFTAPYSLLSQTSKSPAFPTSPPPPQLSSSEPGQSVAPCFPAPEKNSVSDLGVLAYYLQTVSIWSDVIVYLSEARVSLSDRPWQPDSTFSSLTVKIHELERTLSHNHLFSTVSFASQTGDDLYRNREYWLPWVFMQITLHAVVAVLNHPLLHLGAISREGPYPRTFLQQTVDQALFHSQWVFQLLRTCQRANFKVEDPFLGHIIAATATVSWVFQFAKEEKVSKSSEKAVKEGLQYLQAASKTWPILHHQSKLLQHACSLSAVDEGATQSGIRDRTTITFDPSHLWGLLDFNIARLAQKNREMQAGETVVPPPQATICIATKFMHPLAEENSLDIEATGSESRLAGHASASDDADSFFMDFLRNEDMVDVPWLTFQSNT